ncbi:MAG: metal-dependent transcriptional regulator [Synergistaceae bacterium]|jgi:DtxR family Mn-dependent transcriptional regulator|nr:metal-dependent transcriptional regulator [Synergistaceae bacterium]
MTDDAGERTELELTSRIEDYLEAILEIEMSGDVATVTRMAKNLGVTKATITVALKKLKNDGLLEHERYGDVILTAAGREKALAIYRRHDFLTDFFVRILGFSVERAQKVACVMEHELDEATETRLAAFTDVLIQAERKKEEWLRRLFDTLDSAHELPSPMCLLPNGSNGVIARVTAQHDLRKRLQASGFFPGVEISDVRKISDRSGTSFVFNMNGMGIRFGVTEASAVWLYSPRVIG